MKSFKIKIREKYRLVFMHWCIDNNIKIPVHSTGPYYGYDGSGYLCETNKNRTFRRHSNKELFWDKENKKPMSGYVEDKNFGKINGLWAIIQDHEISSYPHPNKTKPMEEKKYRLKQDVELTFKKDHYEFKKGHICWPDYKVNDCQYYAVFSDDEDNVSFRVSELSVEEIPEPKLSEVVKFGDELTCIDLKAYKYAGTKGFLGDHYVYDIGNQILMRVREGFNKYFKLKK